MHLLFYKDENILVPLWPKMPNIVHTNWGHAKPDLNYKNMSTNISLLMPSYGKSQVLTRLCLEEDVYTLKQLHQLFSIRYQPNFEEWMANAARQHVSTGTTTQVDQAHMVSQLKKSSEESWSGFRFIWSLQDEFECQFWTRSVSACLLCPMHDSHVCAARTSNT